MSKLAKELRKKKTEEIETKLKDLQKDLLKLNGKLSSGTQLEKPSRIANLKKEIALSLTVLQERKKEANQKA
ncbi:50S ribosomal protein L29 [Candidatus Woesearchaeota archaeon]|nr:50S ribosomal protein L29 [Candidatus Woesearchaeota archaeon]